MRSNGGVGVKNMKYGVDGGAGASQDDDRGKKGDEDLRGFWLETDRDERRRWGGTWNGAENMRKNEGGDEERCGL